jgi:hypothetical protein
LFRSFHSFSYIRLSLRSICGVHSCILPSPHRRVMWPLAPTIHPTSSGLQGWGRVLGCCSLHGIHCVAFVRASSPPLLSPSCDMAVSTRDPPREQWLAGLGQVLGCTSSSILHGPHFHPASSCSQQQLGWLWWLSFRLVCFVSWGRLQHGMSSLIPLCPPFPVSWWWLGVGCFTSVPVIFCVGIWAWAISCWLPSLVVVQILKIQVNTFS